MMTSKCEVLNGNEVKPCSQLEKATEYGNPRGKQKGIFKWVLSKNDGSDISFSRSFFGVKSGEHVDKGTVFSYCPFCGNQIDEPMYE
jgi:hypothetical protein